MPLPPELMRLLLLLCMLGMAMLAVFFLRERRLTLPAYLSWGLLIVLAPLIGPFLVILMQPGERKTPHALRPPRRRSPNPRLNRRWRRGKPSPGNPPSNPAARSKGKGAARHLR